jgi:hypothetical protein
MSDPIIPDTGAHPLTISPPTFSRYGKTWGRRWRITITSQQAMQSPLTQNIETQAFVQVPPVQINEVLTIEQDGWLPNSLHIKFDTTQAALQVYSWCELVIYNLNAQQSQTVINYGMQCTVEAGYIDGAFGTIFEGTVFQPMWEKERGVDWKLTLRCVVGIIENTDNWIGETIEGGLTQRQVAARMVARASTPIALNFDSKIKDKYVTRATTYFGQPNDLLQYVADSNNALTWYKHMRAYMNALVDQTDQIPQWEFSPDNGLIGNPNQTQEGVQLTVLMQPDLQLLGQVKINQSVVITQTQRQLGNFPMNIPDDFTYIIGRIRHYGDSRGNEWYSDITGFYNNGSILSLRVQT